MFWGLYMRRMWNCIFFNMEVFVTKTQKYCSYIFHGIISLNTGDTLDYSNSLIFSWTQPVFDVLSSLIDGLRSLVILKGQIFAGLFFRFWALIHSEYQADFEANSADFLHIAQNFWMVLPKIAKTELTRQNFWPNLAKENYLDRIAEKITLTFWHRWVRGCFQYFSFLDSLLFIHLMTCLNAGGL